jgi:hypothetical protein
MVKQYKAFIDVNNMRYSATYCSSTLSCWNCCYCHLPSLHGTSAVPLGRWCSLLPSAHKHIHQVESPLNYSYIADIRHQSVTSRSRGNKLREDNTIIRNERNRNFSKTHGISIRKLAVYYAK